MKYHFKSPQEVKETYKDNIKVHPFKNRTFLVIFADIVLIVVIAVFLDKSGYLTEDKLNSKGRYARAGVEFSGSIAQLHSDKEEIILYIKLTNNSFQEAVFPSDTGPLRLANRSGDVEIYKDDQILESKDIRFEQKSIAAGKEVYYKFAIVIPEDFRSAKAELKFQVRMPLEEGEMIIRFY